MSPAKQMRYFYLLPVCLGLLIMCAVALQKSAFSESFWRQVYSVTMPPHIARQIIDQEGSLKDFGLGRMALWLAANLGLNSDTHKINLNVGFESWSSIVALRNRNLDGFVDLPDTYYPATINSNGEELRAKIRLKGMGADHRTHDKKWSFAIKLRGDDSFLGMDSFAIHHPGARRYQAECLYARMLRSAGVSAPRCGVIDVAINGESLGLMVYTERYTVNFLEHQGKKAGLIFELYEPEFEFKDASCASPGNRPVGREHSMMCKFKSARWNKLIAPLRASYMSKVQSDPTLSVQRRAAVLLWERLVSGDVAPSRAFDVAKTAKAIAITFLWGDPVFHPFMYHNLRLYFNPITNKFEPAPSDITSSYEPDGGGAPKMAGNHFDILKMLLNDENIYTALVGELMIAEKNLQDNKWPYLGNFSELQSELMAQLIREFPFLPEVRTLDMLKTRLTKHLPAITRKEFFTPLEGSRFTTPYIPEGPFEVADLVTARHEVDKDRLHLRILNNYPAPVQVESVIVTYLDANGEATRRTELVNNEVAPTLGGMAPSGGRYVGDLDVNIALNGGVSKIEAVEVLSSASWARSPHVKKSLPYPTKQISVGPKLMTVSEWVDTVPWATVDENRRSVSIPSGTWVVRDYLAVPAGFELRINSGTSLKFTEAGGFHVSGPVHILGTSADPVYLQPADSIASWRGITVLDANESPHQNASQIQHAVIQDTGPATSGLWALTGAVTFYNSDVEIRQTAFDGTRAEDALNIVHSQFVLDRVTIQNTRSDAFDADFAIGQVDKSRFAYIGGDAFDVSGSYISLSSSEFLSVYDKAVSVGEASDVDMQSLQIQEVASGIVVKDGSYASVNEVSFDLIAHDSLMVYEKKPSYGPARLEAGNLRWIRGERSFVAQEGSSLVVEGRRIPTSRVDVEALYDGRMRK